jgi:hypothetical protein
VYETCAFGGGSDRYGVHRIPAVPGVDPVENRYFRAALCALGNV